VKLYELHVEGYHQPLSPEQIAELYRAGRLRRADPCREITSQHWRTLDELFPLLKYDSSRPVVAPRPRAARAPVLEEREEESAQSGYTSALKAGWICFGIGLSISWFFPLGNAFFSVAIITAIVAMCTHQVNRGLTLLISSFCGTAVCSLAFFMFVMSAAALTGSAVTRRFETEVKRVQAQQQTVRRLNSALPAPPSLPMPAELPRGPIAAPQFPSQPPQPASTPAQPDRARNEAIRQAELQRDRINAREQQIAQLQKSIDSHDNLIRQIRDGGGDASFFVKERDKLLAEKWNLQR
jgi:hypothetical protein